MEGGTALAQKVSEAKQVPHLKVTQDATKTIHSSVQSIHYYDSSARRKIQKQISNLQEAENKQKQYNADYQKAVQARNEVLKRNKDAQAQLDNLKQERTQLEKKLAEAQKNGVNKLVHDQDTNKAVSTSDAKSEAQKVSQDYEKQKQALSKAEAEYQQETAKADSAYQKAGIDANVANQKNTELAQTAEKASKVEGVTVVQDADENKPADPSNEVQVANDNTKDIQDQIDNINKQIEQIKSENEQIKSNNAIAKQQFDQEYAKWEKGNEVYISKLAQTSGWSKEQIKSFFGDDLSKVTYINANENATVDYGNLQPLTSNDWDNLQAKLPRTYLETKSPQYKHFFKFQKGSTWTYKNAFVNSQTGQAVNAKFTVTDYETDPEYEDLSPALTLNGWHNEPENSMIIDVMQSITPNITIKVQYLDSNTGKPIKLNALFGIGDIDYRQMVKVYNAKKALLGNSIIPLNGSNYLGAVEPKGQGFTPEEHRGQAWFILSPSDSTTFTFGHSNSGGFTFGHRRSSTIEFGVGNIATIYQGNKPILKQSPLKTTTVHWHKSNVALKPKNKVAPKEVHYHFTNLSLNPEKVPDLPSLKQSEVHYHNVDLVLDPHPLPDKTKQITITDTSKKTKEGTQTYHFVDKNTGKVLTTSKVGGEVGKNVSVFLKVPAGYRLVVGQKIPTSANIKDKDTPINILVEKDNNKKPATQTYEFVDKNGNKIVGTAKVNGNVGDKVPVSLKVPNGYKLVAGQKVPTSANIKDKDNPINILVEKDANPERKDGTQTIRFIDKATGKPVSKSTVGGKVGDNIAVDPKVPDGYELVPGQTLPKNVNIKATDTPIDIQVQKKGDNDKNKKPAQQTYQFIDKNGNKVVGTAVVKGNEGDHVPVNLKVPKGYHLVPGQKLPTVADLKATDKPIKILVAKDGTDGNGNADSGINGKSGKANKGNGAGNNAGNGNGGNGVASLPQTGNSKSTAGVLAGTALVATMASLGIAYNKKKRNA